MATAMTLISSQTLGSAVHSVNLSSIPGTYRDLRLVVVGKMATGATAEGTSLRLNGDTTASYNRVYINATGSGSGSSSAYTGDTKLYTESWSTSDWVVYTYDFLDYSVTDKHKTVVFRTGTASSESMAHCGRWASTSAITQITLIGTDDAAGTADNWVVGSTFYLYGISA